MSWPDLFVALTLLVGFWSGYRSGFIREAAVLASILLGWLAAGTFAGWAAPLFLRSGVSPSGAHLIAFWLLFLVVFVIVRLAGYLLDAIPLPSLLSVLSRIGGGLVGCLKAIFALWLILYIALFFPIDKDVRAALRASPSARAVDNLNPPANDLLVRSTPDLVRPLAALVLRHHRI